MKRSNAQAIVLLTLGFVVGVVLLMMLTSDRYELYGWPRGEGSSEQLWRLDKWTGRTWRLEKDVWLNPMADVLHPSTRRGSEK